MEKSDVATIYHITIPLTRTMALDVYERVLDTEASGDQSGIHDPNCSDEQEVLLATLASFFVYRRSAHYTFTYRRRRNFYSLPRAQHEILKKLNFQGTLDKLDECIEKNSAFAEAILKSGCKSFGIDPLSAENWKDLADSGDLDKARSTIKQFLRDWSKEGAAERERCYGPILKAIDKYYGTVVPPCEIRILVPGAGLGRLPFEICSRGYATEGNEFSYHQLIGSNFVLNATNKADEHTIYPFCLGFSHHRERDNQTRGITIPDVHPGTDLNKVLEYHVTDDCKTLPPGIYRYRPSQYFSMSAGEFVDSYNIEESKETYDCVATSFFIDTARNLLKYLETIRNVLAVGGLWINNGPLLWHWEGADATESRMAWESKKTEVKSFDQVEVNVEDAETPLFPPPTIMPQRALSGTHQHDVRHLLSHLGPSGFHGNHATSHQPDPSASAHQHSAEREWRGSLEFSLDEIYQLIQMYGFQIIERGSTKTGYILDEKCMARYVYDAEFWVAVKTHDVPDYISASFTTKPAKKRNDEDEDFEADVKDKGKGKAPQREF
ncbi:hypothetical protein Dda_2258 [Drechslerella dactyloides]|uniref:carnosine N-methyltransferase n=1 Tax=Drechslerella dactyloides TaxID=74499 RepID=A0AAD6J510_DREDA|nr:hypothetical protein Dda_2258 [Drechslerella dactyloides]